MQAKAKKTLARPDVKRMVENVIRCKWSLSVIDFVNRGINRPGAMEREVEGLTAKVLNERLRKLVRFGIFSKTSYPEVPPRVEYGLTEFGKRFVGLLETIEQIEQEFSEKG
jgi:DNA-binding HxlR family transcriptional regulator